MKFWIILLDSSLNFIGKEIIRLILEHPNTKLITEKEKKAFKSSGYSLGYRVMMMNDKV